MSIDLMVTISVTARRIEDECLARADGNRKTSHSLWTFGHTMASNGKRTKEVSESGSKCGNPRRQFREASRHRKLSIVAKRHAEPACLARVMVESLQPNRGSNNANDGTIVYFSHG